MGTPDYDAYKASKQNGPYEFLPRSLYFLPLKASGTCLGVYTAPRAILACSFPGLLQSVATLVSRRRFLVKAIQLTGPMRGRWSRCSAGTSFRTADDPRRGGICANCSSVSGLNQRYSKGQADPSKVAAFCAVSQPPKDAFVSVAAERVADWKKIMPGNAVETGPAAR